MVADTRERILEAARLTVQDRGYGGLSFRELAAGIGIKSASIHYYFPTKGELGGALAGRYTADFAVYLDTLLDQEPDLAARIAGYVAVFGNTLRNANRICLAAILAAELSELPEEVRVEVVRFGRMNEDWLARALSADRSLSPEEVRHRASAIFTAVTGAQLIARARGDTALYEEIIAAYRASGLLP